MESMSILKFIPNEEIEDKIIRMREIDQGMARVVDLEVEGEVEVEEVVEEDGEVEEEEEVEEEDNNSNNGKNKITKNS